jgi:CRISPR-associated endonuclease/helicase Cas3
MDEDVMGEAFAEFVSRATCGFGPYDYQERLAAGGLPDLLSVPTGSGKTLAAVLPWLWRLRNAQPAGEPGCLHRLVYVLPMRALVEQTVAEVGLWLERLGLAGEVQLHVLMGGADRDDDAWQLDPAAAAVFVGTQDMVLSRALMRGYAEPRSRWPVSFGLLHAGTQWVFDETQLLGPALGTSAQLQGLREVLGTAPPTASGTCGWSRSATRTAQARCGSAWRLPAVSCALTCPRTPGRTRRL